MKQNTTVTFPHVYLRSTNRIAALLVAVAMTAGGVLLSAQQKSPPADTQIPTIKVPVEVVNVFFVAKDKRGGLISDLVQNEITVEEDGKSQPIAFYERDTSVPLTIAMMIDTSGSIGAADILSLEQEGSMDFLRAVMRKGDLSLVIHFDLDVELDQDFTDNFTALEKAIQTQRVNTGGGGHQGPVKSNIGGTHLYDAIVLACNDRLREEAGRRVMVLVTDGDDQGSKYKLNDAVTAAQKANTIIYPIYFQPSSHFRFSMGYPGPQYSGDTGVLNKLADETGGKAYFPRSVQDLRKTYDQIATELHQQYRLGYTPTNVTRDGGYRKIGVQTSRHDVKITARKGYYAPRD